MSEESADSIVKAAKKMHQNQMIMIPSYAHIERYEDGEHMHTQYMFMNKEFNNMTDILECAAQQGHVPCNFYEEGRVECKRTYEGSTDNVEKKIIAIYQKGN